MSLLSSWCNCLRKEVKKNYLELVVLFVGVALMKQVKRSGLRNSLLIQNGGIKWPDLWFHTGSVKCGVSKSICPKYPDCICE